MFFLTINNNITGSFMFMLKYQVLINGQGSERYTYVYYKLVSCDEYIILITCDSIVKCSYSPLNTRIISFMQFEIL